MDIFLNFFSDSTPVIEVRDYGTFELVTLNLVLDWILILTTHSYCGIHCFSSINFQILKNFFELRVIYDSSFDIVLF